MKRVFIVHGWDGHPEEGWFPWLKKELESRGFSVFIPQLPNANEPRINSWVPALAHAVGILNEETFFVGHSMGCQTIARYLESLPEKQRVGGAIFVAGFFKHLSNLEDDAIVRHVVREWLKTPLHLEKIRSHLNKSVALFSDNDPYVPLDNQETFRNDLGSDIVIEHNKGHFSGSNGIVELPAALNALLSITR